MVTPCSVTCENVGIVVITRDEKTSKGTLYNVHEAGRLRQSFWVVSLDGADCACFSFHIGNIGGEEEKVASSSKHALLIFMQNHHDIPT